MSEPGNEGQHNDASDSGDLFEDATEGVSGGRSPQLWSDETELPSAATPVVEEPVVATHATPTERQSFVRRTKARALALQMLFQADVNEDTSAQDVADQLRERLPQADLFQFAWDLYRGVLNDQTSLDEAIAATSTNWKLTRMAVTDRNILRLGTYELRAMDTPYGVVLDEAVDLAKRFGTTQSAAFVNGVLDKLVPESKRPASAVESNATVSNATGTDEAVDADDAAAEELAAGQAAIPANASPEEVAALSPQSPIAFRRRTSTTGDADADSGTSEKDES